MTLLKIVSMGHPVLRRLADPVADPTDPEIARLAADMIETMRDAPGIGLAAPQIYRPLRLIVFEVPAARQEEGEPPAPDGPTVLVNPEIVPLDEETVVGLEGCLSIPGFRGLVPRWRRIGYRALGLDGKVIEREAEGLHGRVVQHEVDHLDGVLYLDRLRDLNDLASDSEARYLTDRV
ncbi:MULTISPECIES: peptide deformylase [Inquilinus]|uniref:Peptide deformylase n=1 Tax=Inquilinus ginsengisoli TaxID=363840 RepID=A0ABU1JIY3_9PROT|nr:peptide deformylase [Inquilinus ginsengisoli]MDR6288575.1 peptide deformylase [Inquilinus ginsengisoli]